jgi:hypothetical protein
MPGEPILFVEDNPTNCALPHTVSGHLHPNDRQPGA